MPNLKCKMCGGSMEIAANETIAVCEYCGTQQTLPRLDNERKANLYDRASHFRRNNEFDRAIGIYEQILAADETDAESYWSLVLCRYGIEYVEDPASHKRVPTVNRTQTTSIFTDEDYLAAMRYADDYQRSIYEAEAKEIDRIQKEILAVSQQEEPFDVFICYKETDNGGRRTMDSVLAMDLYKELTNEGYRVFFSRITLEDKLGTAYEPFIFAALNSAKVMIVVGTRPEHFNAVWVKNEWSRYLALIRNGAKKYLIPAYRDMDPYDLPEEFSHLQAQDMSKLGFLQDLVHGVQKLIGTKTAAPVSDNTEQLIKRAFLALEDGDWQKADEFCEQVLNRNAEHPMAYLGKLMAALHVRQEAELARQSEPFDGHPMYQKVQRFDDGLLSARLQGYNDAIRSARAQAEQEKAAQKEQRKLQLTNKKSLTRVAVAAAVALVVGIAAVFGVKSHQKKIAAYEDALALMNAGSYAEAIEAFTVLDGFQDSAEQIAIAEGILEEARLQEEAYAAAIALLENKQYAEAVTAFEALGEYKEASAYLTEAQIGAENLAAYEEAAAVMEVGDFEAAAALFKELNDFEDSKAQLKLCQTELAWTGFRKCIDGVETVDFEMAAKYLEILATYDAAEYCDSGYYELANLAYAADQAAQAEEYLNKVSAPESFDDHETLSENIRVLKLYQDAWAIEVTDEDTKSSLQALIDQLPEDYRNVAELKQRIVDYDNLPKLVDNSIIVGTWSCTYGNPGITWSYIFKSDGTLIYDGKYSQAYGTYYIQKTKDVLYLTISKTFSDGSGGTTTYTISVQSNSMTMYYAPTGVTHIYTRIG